MTGRRHGIALSGSLLALGVLGSSVAIAAASTPHTTAPLQKISVAPYNNIVANATLHTYYLLSVEKSGVLHCKSSCLSFWKPFLVKNSVTTVKAGTGVKNKVSFVSRSATMKQVKLNGYPVYTYLGDTGPKQTNGEGVTSSGGTWYLVNATTSLAGPTPVKPKALLTTSNVAPYINVLGNAARNSLYVLSVESGGVFSCTASCLATWPPVLVPSSTTSILVATGVSGSIGFAARAGGMSQVTFNGFPLYGYTGDYGAQQAYGEGVAADGGTWYLANSSSTSNGTTEIPVHTGSTTTTTYNPGY